MSDEPSGVEDGSNGTLADIMGQDHAAHRQRTQLRSQTRVPLSNLAV